VSDLFAASGQEHLTGPDGALTRLLASGSLGSTIFWGPWLRQIMYQNAIRERPDFTFAYALANGTIDRP